MLVALVFLRGRERDVELIGESGGNMVSIIKHYGAVLVSKDVARVSALALAGMSLGAALARICVQDLNSLQVYRLV